MYHKEPTEVKIFFENLQNEKQIRKCKQGAHINDPGQGYTLLKELTEAWNKTAFDNQKYKQAKEKLIKWFGIDKELQSVLLFLHESLNKEVKGKETLENVFNINEKEKGGLSIEGLIRNLEKMNKDDYNIGLIKLREHLLKKTGVIKIDKRD